MKQYQIFVTNKEGIFDPAGETSKNALSNLGYSSVSRVNIGKFIELEVADGTSDAEIEEMCQKLLANPVIEDYKIRTI